jgi:hypothetical protein
MGRGKKLPVVVRDQMGVNPFIASLEVRVRSVRSGYVPEEGMMVDNLVEMEVESYFKVFDNATQRVVMVGLSFRALQVWTWVMYTIESGVDYIRMNVDRSMQECRIKSLKTYRAAISELCRYGYIAPCVGHKNVYWINPSIGFKGSRVKAFPSCVVKRGNYE